MSVLNQMLRDLEKRGAMPDVVAAAGTATVARPALALQAPVADTRRRWVWVAVLGVGAAFVAIHTWLSYRVQDAGTVRSPLGARQFAGVAKAGAAEPQAPAQATPVAAAPVAVAAPEATRQPIQASAPDTPRQSAPVSTQDDTTVRTLPKVAATAPRATAESRAPRAASNAAAPRTPASRPSPRNDVATPSAPPSAPAPATDNQAAAVVVRSSDNVAPDIDRAAELIARGRSTEAIDLLARVLARQPTHAGARGSLAALLAEAGRREQALHVLLAGSEIDPARFAAPAAQLQAELGDLNGALATLGRVTRTARTPQFEALHAGLAQRAGDHMTAIAAYRRALVQPQADAVWWVGLGVSLEATGEPAEARNAYASAAAESRLPADVRRYVTDRLAALSSPQARRNEDARKAELANVF